MRIADRFKSFRMQKHATTNNIVDRIESAEASGRDRFNSFTRADRLDALSTNTGTLVADALISPAADVTSVEPTDSTFTGVAMGGEGWTFGSTVYHFVAVASGALQAGFNYLGKLIAGGGAVTLDENGISIVESSFDPPDTNALKIGDSELYVYNDGSLKQLKAKNSGAGNRESIMNANKDLDHYAHTSAKATDSYSRTALYSYDYSDGAYSEVIAESDNTNGETILLVANGATLASVKIDAQNGEIILNNYNSNVDTIIKGDTATIATFDAGLNAVGIGGAADSGGTYVLKVTGSQNITNGLIVDLNAVINESGAATNFRVESDSDPYNIFSDGTNNRVGIGTGTPATKLEVSGQTTTAGITTSGFLNLGAAVALTIASDAVTATKSYHTIDTEGGAATDNLATINGGTVGDILILRTANNARDVTVKDGTGNIALAGDFLMDTIQDTLTLLYNGTTWLEVSRSNNA